MRRRLVSPLQSVVAGVAGPEPRLARREVRDGGKERAEEEDDAALDDKVEVGTVIALQRHAVALRSELRRVRFCLLQKPQLGSPAVAGSPWFMLRPVLLSSAPAAAMAGKKGSGGGVGASTELERVFTSEGERRAAREERYTAHRRLHRLSSRWQLAVEPRRHLGWALVTVACNAVAAVRNGALAVVAFPVDYRIRGEGVTRGVVAGLGTAAAFFGLGFVLSPLLHLTQAALNTTFGLRNAVAMRFVYDAVTGRYWVSNVRAEAALQARLADERDFMARVGRERGAAQNLESEAKWREHAERIFPSLMGGGRKQQGGGAAREQSLYEVLNVKRGATAQEIKTQYQRLVKVYHPDVNEREYQEEAARKFHEINKAYKVLSNAEKRQQYDMGGAAAVEANSDGGAILGGNPMEILQKVFGGAVCEARLTGPYYRSVHHLRHQGKIKCGFHEFEKLTSIRVRLLAVELAKILDVHALGSGGQGSAGGAGNGKSGTTTTAAAASKSSLGRRGASSDARGSTTTSSKDSSGAGGAATTAAPTREYYNGALFSRRPASLRAPPPEVVSSISPEFATRALKFVRRIAKGCCFGEEVLFEVGEAYVVNAQAHLGLTHFAEPKKLVVRKMLQGFTELPGRTYKAMTANNAEQGLRAMLSTYFHNEWDALCSDLHMVLRWAIAEVVFDVSVADEGHRTRRLHALWYLGHLMRREGIRFGSRRSVHDDDNQFAVFIRRRAVLETNNEVFEF